MPLYPVDLTVPANTSSDSPVKQEVDIEGDYLTRVEVLFPSGCCCLVGFQLRYGEMPLLPSDPDAYVKGDDETIRADMRWRIPECKTRLTLLAYNVDELYDHTLYVRLYTAWEHEMEPTGLQARMARLLVAFLEHVLGLRRGRR